MESHTNYEDFDDMENPDQFTESQELPVDEHPVNGIVIYLNCNYSCYSYRKNVLFYS